MLLSILLPNLEGPALVHDRKHEITDIRSHENSFVLHKNRNVLTARTRKSWKIMLCKYCNKQPVSNSKPIGTSVVFMRDNGKGA